MRRALLAAILGLALLAGCGGKSAAPPTPKPAPSPPTVTDLTAAKTPEEQAIRAVFDSPAGTSFAALFPKSPKSAPCLIPRGGPSPRQIKGRCASAVRYNWGGQGPLVVFSESWPWHSFHYAGTRRRPLEHRWSFRVEGGVRFVSQSGDFPPQYAR